MDAPDGYRTNHQVHSKYKDINAKIAKFAAIYNNLLNTRGSGMSDGQVLENAHYRYREDNHGHSFNHQKCWDVLKTYPRWAPIPLVDATGRPSKRSKTPDSATGSSSAHTFFDLNDVDDDDDDDEAIPTEPIRPVGRNKARRAASGSTGSGSKEKMSSLIGELSKIHTNNETLLEVRKRQLELQQADRKQKDFEFYLRPTDHLSGGALSNMMKMKEELRLKYNWDPL
jgi:hypothetical protein